MKNLVENKELCFLDESVAEEFFEKVCSTDVWKTCYTKELKVIPIDNAPILEQNIRSELLISPEVSSDSLLENMEELNIGLQIPFDEGYVGYPLGDTAYGTLVQRAGFQNSPVLFIQKNKAAMNAMSPYKKADVINMGLACYKNLSLVLIRDEKVRAVLSGDKSDYVVLPFNNLMESLKVRLTDMFFDVAFKMAFASHSFFGVEYKFKAGGLGDLTTVFAKRNVDTSDMSLSVKLVSSDVGLSGANLFPYIHMKNNSFMLGKPLVLTHKNQHSLVDFNVNIAQLDSVFLESAEKIEDMNRQAVKYPAGCLLRAAKQAGLPKKLSCEAAEAIEAMYGSNCLQIDIFMALYEILEKYDAEVDLSLSRRVLLEEGISRIVFSRFSDYDLPFQWE